MQWLNTLAHVLQCQAAWNLCKDCWISSWVLLAAQIIGAAQSRQHAKCQSIAGDQSLARFLQNLV